MTAEERMAIRHLIDSRKRQRIARIVLSGIEHREQHGEIEPERAAQVRAKMAEFAPAPPILRVVPDPSSDEKRAAFETLLRHQYKQPVPGYCMGFINLGVNYSNRVRCSRRARYGEFCGTHEKKRAKQLATAA